MIKKYKIVFIIIFLLLVLLIGLWSGFKIYFSFKYPEKKIKTILTERFRKNFNRAVKFDSMSITPFGNIELHNFVLSASSDFNDNINFIKSKKAVFKQNFDKLINNKISVEKIIISDAVITIQKPSGKPYTFVINQIKDLIRPVNSIDFLDKKKFNISVQNASIRYSEILEDNSIKISTHSINGEIFFIDGKPDYHFDGLIDSNNGSESNHGKFAFSGSYIKNKSDYKHTISIKNFDISRFNNFLLSYKIISKILKGSVSVNTVIIEQNKKYNCNGIIQLEKINITNKKPVQFNIISNQDFKILFDIDYNNSSQSISVKQLTINNSNFNINTKGSYDHNKKNKKIIANISTNSIDLSKLSPNFTPIKGISYKGTLKCNGFFEYDALKKSKFKSNYNMSLNNFSIFRLKDDKKQKIISNARVVLKIDNSKTTSSIVFNTEKSDYKIKTSINFHNLHPLKSNTNISIYSKRSALDELLLPVDLFIQYCYKEAIKDSKKGYEEIFFLQKPLAQYLNNNDISLSLQSNKINVGNKAQFYNCNFEFKLTKGIVALKNFNINGYNAQYNFEFHGYFNRDYPLIKANASIKNFDSGMFSRDYGLTGSVEGSASCELEYELTAYRISHLLTNARGKYSFQMLKPVFADTSFQNTLQNYLQKNGYLNVSLSNLHSNYISVNITQYSDKYHIRNLSLSSPQVQFNSYGTYQLKKGLDFTVLSQIKGEKKYFSIPIHFTGTLPSICFNIKNKPTQKKCL